MFSQLYEHGLHSSNHCFLLVILSIQLFPSHFLPPVQLGWCTHSWQCVSSYLQFFYQWPPYMPKRKERRVGGGSRMWAWLMLSAGGDFTTRVQGPSWRVQHKSRLCNFWITLLSSWCLCFWVHFYFGGGNEFIRSHSSHTSCDIK